MGTIIVPKTEPIKAEEARHLTVEGKARHEQEEKKRRAQEEIEKREAERKLVEKLRPHVATHLSAAYANIRAGAECSGGHSVTLSFREARLRKEYAQWVAHEVAALLREQGYKVRTVNKSQKHPSEYHEGSDWSDSRSVQAWTETWLELVVRW